MPDLSRQLAELVRLLQEKGHIFAADPEPLTDALRHAEGGMEERLLHRAAMIDSDGRLKNTLLRVRQTAAWLLLAATAFWAVGGFSATAALMRQQGLNFFFVLAGVLGVHTLMLLLWLASVVLLRGKGGGFFTNPATWIRGRDPVNRAVLRLYTEEWQQPHTRWLVGKTTHRLWLATLFGMLAAVVLLLSVRQYTFNWESTLLSDGTFVNAVRLLGMLPALLGFPVPDEAAVLGSRMGNATAFARQWGGLLIGSIVCYGIVPRAAAWLACTVLARGKGRSLPLDKPYYQHIISRWQQKITDADTQGEAVAAVSPKIALNDAAKWAVMLDAPWPDAGWFKHILGQDWLDKGLVSGRDGVAALTAELGQKPVQLLIGVRAAAVPDRGILRQTVALAESAQGGAVVQLLAGSVSDGLEETLAQWRNALAERNIPWLEPPKISQEKRLAAEQAV
ncbi:DUF2868 domain-containing protein [Neisseria sp.]|uniref:DUF2868 domain-containing protein n=1 Tax=Neisseria sp. TaxID=192066 RepID=UPI0035A19CD5